MATWNLQSRRKGGEGDGVKRKEWKALKKKVASLEKEKARDANKRLKRILSIQFFPDQCRVQKK